MMAKKINDSPLALSLLLLRAGIFLVMLMWSLDKFFRPDRARAVFEGFYGLAGLGDVLIYILGGIQLLISVGFVLGVYKTITYGAVLVMHAASTFASLPRYFAPFDNLLFFAAIPMLAGCVTLFLLRDRDTLATLQ